jgi:succinoglycan biosynthesis protein ExoO
MNLSDQTGLEGDLTVSVVIPTHNRAELCLRAIASALQQSAPPLEVIICDDRSTDGIANSVAALQRHN